MSEFDPKVLTGPPVPPPAEFQKRAGIRSLDEYRQLYQRAYDDPEGFWGEQARLLDWFEPPKKALEWNMPHAKWFVGGKLNVSYNCLDRHLEKNANKPALLWEAEDGKRLEFTYAELHERVCRAANVLLDLGVKASDCVTIYLPMIPELPIAMLACARIGAMHSVVFGGFSAPGAGRPHRRRQIQAAHRRRRRLPPRPAHSPQGNLGYGPREMPDDPKSADRPAHRGESSLERRSRPLVARGCGHCLSGLPR